MFILGIETSCDETAAAIIKTNDEDKTADEVEVISNVVSSQIALHAKWGGVVPNLAAREHLKNILPVIETCFKNANLTPREIDLIAVTKGPGLIPALLIGTNTAKTLAYVWKKPIIGIHHVEGHIYANFINKKQPDKISFPLLCLVVSGGHTQLVLMKKHLDYEVIGETVDDAAGEAFDKVARMLGLPYPGGPEVSKRASLAESTTHQFLDADLPRPMIGSNDFNFSFSGLKTAVLYKIKKNEVLLNDENFVNEMCREFQQAVIDVLISKTIRAAKKHAVKTVTIAGGVSANTALRNQLQISLAKNFPEISYAVPELQYSADNAAMIAAAGYFRWRSEQTRKISSWKDLPADANLKL